MRERVCAGQGEDRLITGEELTMVVATLNSGHFNWIALGNTNDEALDALIDAWERHQKEYNGAVSFSEFRDDVMFQELQPGQCSRDGWIM